jgi:penicillin-binding protein 2
MRLESKLNVVKEYRYRYIWLVLAVVLAFVVLAARLAHLQLLHGQSYLELSEHNFVQERLVPTLRGRIVDQQGRVLAGNRPAYNVFLTPAFVSDPDSMLVQVENYLNLSEDQSNRLRRTLAGARGLLRFREILVKEDIDREQVAILESQKLKLPGLSIRPGPRRYYPFGSLLAHAIGYVGRISEREMDQNPTYQQNDTLGKKGVELAFESELRGRHGLERVVVDAQGRVKSNSQSEVLLREEPRIEPLAGHDLVLSLDLDLQQAADKAFFGRAGSLVMMDVETGFVKVWLSKPGFDPNDFVGGIPYSEWQRLQNSIFDPLLDKVAQSAYFPGSTYKVVTALAGLEKKVVVPSTTATCYGSKKVGSHTFRCWNRGGHGAVNLFRAIQQSCDVYFYTIAEQMEYPDIRQYAAWLGLGEPTGIDLNNETGGMLPTVEWHEKIHKRRWFTGDTVSHVIGQGDLKVSPLQLAVLYAAIANGGSVLQPQMVEAVLSPEGKVLRRYQPAIRRKLDVDPQNLALLREALAMVVNKQGGTAYLSRLENPQFAGKTGSAQVARLPQKGREHELYLLKDHAWFVGFGPVDEPKIVVVGMVEHGSHGSWVAPVVRDLIAAWYKKTTGNDAKYPAYRHETPLREVDSMEGLEIE